MSGDNATLNAVQMEVGKESGTKVTIGKIQLRFYLFSSVNVLMSVMATRQRENANPFLTTSTTRTTLTQTKHVARLVLLLVRNVN